MVFCSVGTQLPFNRLVEYIVKWSSEVDGNQSEIIIQSGIPPQFKLPDNIKVLGFISVNEFSSIFSKADFVVSHAGMGNIISSLEMAKPIIIVPRLSTLKEHRNDHQVDTANRFSELKSVFISHSYDDFCKAVDIIKGFNLHQFGLTYPERDKLIGFINGQISN